MAAPRPADGLAAVRDWTARDRHRVAGLMTGTSADGLDVALVDFTGLGLESAHALVAYRETPLDPALRREILAVAAAETLTPERLMRLDAALGEHYAAAVLELAASLPDGRPIEAIGLHGQTVRHVPRNDGGGTALTLQLGSAAVMAERTGLPVVSNFRARDTAAGGEGAPLVPIVDWWLFRSDAESRALLNLGGMANLTWLPRGAGLEAVLAFDTGPGNAVIDAVAEITSGGREPRDPDGRGAAAGRASESLLAELLADPFFARTPPRSTGRERFGTDYARRLIERGQALGLAREDLLATATELTAATVADAARRFIAPRGGVDAWIVSGGGAHNRTLRAALERRLAPARVGPPAGGSVPPDAKEALAFAFLAHLTLCGRPGNVPTATGAARAAVLGQITPGGLS